jgi:IclR family acetate operon transcriptional repressor
MNDAMAAVNAGGAQRVQSVDRAAALLRAVGEHREPAAVADLAAACALNRSTAWRILSTLEHHGLVERDPATGRYTVGYAMIALAAAAGHDPLVRRAHPVLEALAQECGETVSLAVPRQLQLVYVDQVQAPHVMAADWLGRATPLHATSTGKAFLARLAPEERAVALAAPLERFTDTTITDRGALAVELDAVRQDGYALSRGELEPALWGASAPVLAGPRVVAVASVWGTEARIRARGLQALGERTARAAGAIGALVAAG